MTAFDRVHEADIALAAMLYLLLPFTQYFHIVHIELTSKEKSLVALSTHILSSVKYIIILQNRSNSILAYN